MRQDHQAAGHLVPCALFVAAGSPARDPAPYYAKSNGGDENSQNPFTFLLAWAGYLKNHIVGGLNVYDNLRWRWLLLMLWILNTLANSAHLL